MIPQGLGRVATTPAACYVQFCTAVSYTVLLGLCKYNKTYCAGMNSSKRILIYRNTLALILLPVLHSSSVPPTSRSFWYSLDVGVFISSRKAIVAYDDDGRVKPTFIAMSPAPGVCFSSTL